MDIATALKKTLSEYLLRELPEKNVAILLSGGVDSISLLLLLLELGYNVTAYNFHITGIMSTDFIRAKQVSRFLGVRFEEILLKNNIDEIIPELFQLCREYPMKTKTDFECFYPLSTAFGNCSERCIVTGLGSDGNFGTSKKALIHFKDNPELFRDVRIKNSKNGKYAQKTLCDMYGEKTGRKIVSPYRSVEVAELLAQYNWYELNKPRQKWPIVFMFYEVFQLLGAPKNQAFQCGDSGIQELFQQLVSHDINVRGSKISTGVFNQIKDIVEHEKIPGALPYRSQGNLFKESI